MNHIKTLSRFFCLLTIIYLFSMVSIAQEDDDSIIKLPEPPQKGNISIEEALWKRCSTRAYTDQVPTWEQVGRMLWAAQGINRPKEGKRTCPSAGETYPLEIYLMLPSGVYHYLPEQHALEIKRKKDVRGELTETYLNQKNIYQSPCVFIFTAVFKRTIDKYGEEATRYVYLEGGHAAQNIILQAIALGMGSVPIGAPLYQDSKDVLGIPGNEDPIYILAVGYAKEEKAKKPSK